MITCAGCGEPMSLDNDPDRWTPMSKIGCYKGWAATGETPVQDYCAKLKQHLATGHKC